MFPLSTNTKVMTYINDRKQHETEVHSHDSIYINIQVYDELTPSLTRHSKEHCCNSI